MAQPAVEAALKDGDPLVRSAALAYLEVLPPAERLALASAALRDPVRAVRLAAAHALADAERGLPAGARADFDRALAELIAAESVNAERPESHLNLANVQHRVGRPDAAEAELRTALRLDPRFTPALVNLADLLRTHGSADDTERLLREALAIAPDNAEALHALGLLRVREGRRAEALDLLRRAAARNPDSTRFAYVYAVALHDSGAPAQAITVLEQAHRRRQADPDVLTALVSYLRERGDEPAARRYAEALAALAR